MKGTMFELWLNLVSSVIINNNQPSVVLVSRKPWHILLHQAQNDSQLVLHDSHGLLCK